MKKILVTGANSYVGTSFKKWLGKYPNTYITESIDLRSDSWKEKDFSQYDVIFHTAGIAHIKETKKNKELFFQVNRDLAYEVAYKAKSEGVKHFIFLSSMSVYGIDNGLILSDSTLNPKSSYGRSKLEAEKLINALEHDSFKVAVLRPPMIYGKDCRGNYPKLVKIALNSPCFPSVENKRSMIYIDNFCEFVRLLIDDCAVGTYFPQNEEYVCTSHLVKVLAAMHGKKIHILSVFNPLFKILKSKTLNKVFGNLIYDKKLSDYTKKYCIYEFNESIILSETRL